jgi:antitoxin CptB
MNPTSELPPEKKRILYQSWHRGCKETDLVLGPFAEAFLPQCSEEGFQQFVALLAEEDWDIWDWVTNYPHHTPAAHRAVMAEIHQHWQKRHA